MRLVGYFTVVAKHANFGRAAAALHVAQPSLSRQIQRLEEHLGVRLFDRTPPGPHRLGNPRGRCRPSDQRFPERLAVRSTRSSGSLSRAFRGLRPEDPRLQDRRMVEIRTGAGVS